MTLELSLCDYPALDRSLEYSSNGTEQLPGPISHIKTGDCTYKSNCLFSSTFICKPNIFDNWAFFSQISPGANLHSHRLKWDVPCLRSLFWKDSLAPWLGLERGLWKGLRGCLPIKAQILILTWWTWYPMILTWWTWYPLTWWTWYVMEKILTKAKWQEREPEQRIFGLGRLCSR